MSGGNGIDIAAVYQLLTEVAGMVAAQGRKLDNLERRIELLERQIREQGVELVALKRSAAEQAEALARLRREVADYHSSVLGHGILISEMEERVRLIAELDERVRRIEQHLNLPPVQ